MKKIFCTILILLVLAAALFADKPVTTVMDFQTNNISEGDMRSIVTFLSASLHDTGRYTVIDTAQRDVILEELAFSNSGCTDESCQLEIGKLLSAEYIITGDIALVGGRYILTARMLETETSATVQTAKGIYEDLGLLIDKMPVFASQLSGETKAVSAPIAETPAETTGSDETISGKQPMSGRRIAAWSTLGAGAVAAGAGGYLLYAAFDYKSANVDPAYSAYMDDSTSTYENSVGDYYNSLWADYETVYSEFAGKLTVSSIVAGVGLISIGVSVFLFLTEDASSEKTESPEVALLLKPSPSAVSLVGRIRM